MSRWQYDRHCPGCRPVAVDLQTGELCGPDHPLAVAMAAVWAKQSELTKAAFHHVTCQNSRAPIDLALVRPFLEELQKCGREV